MNGFIKFLGTAGARIVVTKQLRASGGIWLSNNNTSLLIDPGPGSLVRALSSRPKLDPGSLDAILLSHRHLDHSNDMNIMVEAMTEGTFKKRGEIFLPHDCLAEEPVLYRYLQNSVEKINFLAPGKSYILNDLEFNTPVSHIHSVETYGFRFKLPGNLIISVVTDTLFTEELIAAYKPTSLLIINAVRLKKEPSSPIQHLSIPDAEKLIQEIKPQMAILTHFGLTVLKAKPWLIAQDLTQKLGIPVVAARDGWKLELNQFPLSESKG